MSALTEGRIYFELRVRMTFCIDDNSLSKCQFHFTQSLCRQKIAPFHQNMLFNNVADSVLIDSATLQQSAA